MITVPSTEFSKNFGQYREIAQREPVAVTSHDRVTGYFLSSAQYAEYVRLKNRERRVYHISELPDETIRAIANARMDPRHDHLNSLLDE
jgi:hypothetical protein